MGRYPDPQIPAEQNRTPQLPLEDPDAGCPGSWYRTRFMASLSPYLRRVRPMGDGWDRDSNPLLDRCEDDLVVQWVLYFELEQNRALHRIAETRD